MTEIMISQRMKHVQQTLLSLGDEFLVQYCLCARPGFYGNQILSRLFSMGHSLELYAKAALVSPEGVPPQGHDVPALINQFDDSLALTKEEISAGETLFRPDAANIDLGLWERHGEAMELYQAMYFLKDLKYYIAIDGNIIFPVRKSLKPINDRYLGMVARLRSSLEHRDPRVDEELLDLVAQLGFEENPLNAVVDNA